MECEELIRLKKENEKLRKINGFYKKGFEKLLKDRKLKMESLKLRMFHRQ